MYSEEFILIPKRMYVTKVANEKHSILNNPNLKRKAAHLTLLQRQKANLKPVNSLSTTKMSSNAIPRATQYEQPEISKPLAISKTEERPRSDTDEFEYEGDDEEDSGKTINIQDESYRKKITAHVLRSLEMMQKSKLSRASVILETLINTPTVAVQLDGTISIDEQRTSLKIVPFLYNLQQPTKVLEPIEDYQAVLSLLEIASGQVGNTYAKSIINNLRGGQKTHQSSNQDLELYDIKLEEDEQEEADDDDEEEEEENEDTYFTLPRENKGKWWSFG